MNMLATAGLPRQDASIPFHATAPPTRPPVVLRSILSDADGLFAIFEISGVQRIVRASQYDLRSHTAFRRLVRSTLGIQTGPPAGDWSTLVARAVRRGAAA